MRQRKENNNISDNQKQPTSPLIRNRKFLRMEIVTMSRQKINPTRLTSVNYEAESMPAVANDTNYAMKTFGK